MAFDFFNKGRRSARRPRRPPAARPVPTEKWPVLHYGSVPKFDPAKWDFKVSGLVENPITLSATSSSGRCRRSVVKKDIHCVTRWSMFDSDWRACRSARS